MRIGAGDEGHGTNAQVTCLSVKGQGTRLSRVLGGNGWKVRKTLPSLHLAFRGHGDNAMDADRLVMKSTIYLH